jgi:multisubunit Na+/H+ antiporter MnhB subunit
MTLAVDLIAVALILTAALWATFAPERRDAVIALITLGLALSLAWMRLGSVDIALTEAAVGGGATGLVLLRACSFLDRVEPATRLPGWRPQLAVAALCAVVGASLVAASFGAPEPAPTLAPQAAAGMGAVGLENPVTVVLLAYRAIDTLLEKIVLVLALVAVWSLSPDGAWGGAPPSLRVARPSGALDLLARVLPPVGLLVGVYLVWTGADHPGGTFQGGALLAAMWLLLMLAGLTAPPETGRPGLRLAATAGPGLFIAVGLAGIPLSGWSLSYPPDHAKPMIVAVEAVLALSIAVILAMLVAGPAVSRADR